MFEKITKFFSEWWDKVVEFLLWLPIKIFDLFLDAVATIIEAIPSPDFIVNNALGDYIHEDVLWLASQTSVNDGLAIIAAATVFRFLRRVLTLGIW